MRTAPLRLGDRCVPVVQVLKADLLGTVPAALEPALNVRRVAVEQDGAHGHGGGFLRIAVAVAVVGGQAVWLLAHHDASGLSGPSTLTSSLLTREPRT